jgi:hypothetical protein
VETGGATLVWSIIEIVLSFLPSRLKPAGFVYEVSMAYAPAGLAFGTIVDRLRCDAIKLLDLLFGRRLFSREQREQKIGCYGPDWLGSSSYARKQR